MFKMLKIILAALLFSCHFLFALDIDEKVNKLSISSDNLLSYIDKDRDKSFEEILANQDKLFLHVKKNIFTYSNEIIWTKLTLHNKSKKELEVYLLNHFSALDEVDVYLVKNNKLYEKFFFGDMRAVTNKEILNRFTNINIKIEAKKSVDIFVRYASSTPINTELELFSKSFYDGFIFKDFTIWGFFVGISLALILYNFMIYLSLKQKAFLFYVLHALVNVYNTLTSSGHIYALLSPYFGVEFLNITYKITPSLAIIFMSSFIITLFDLKKNIKWLYYLNFGVIYLFSAFMFVLFFFYTNDTILIYNKIASILIQFSLLFMLLSACVIVYKRLSGSLYFFLGTGFLVLSIFLYVLHFLGRIDFGIWSIYISTLGRTVDIVFLSMALGKRIKNIETQRLENAFLVEQSNKFNSTSYLLAGILHQFKQPIIHLGSEVLNLRVLQYKKATSDKEEEGILKNMETQIEGMSVLVENFYSFYSSESNNATFNLENSIDKTLSILHSSLKAYNIEVKKEYESINLNSNEKILNQVLLIILENAISILDERKVQNPMIEIFTCKDEKGIKITIKDNAGGIAAQDIKKVFTVHYSERKTKGLGIGLALAKNLIETRLAGKIEVANEKKGAAFTIRVS